MRSWVQDPSSLIKAGHSSEDLSFLDWWGRDGRIRGTGCSTSLSELVNFQNKSGERKQKIPRHWCLHMRMCTWTHTHAYNTHTRTLLLVLLGSSAFRQSCLTSTLWVSIQHSTRNFWVPMGAPSIPNLCCSLRNVRTGRCGISKYFKNKKTLQIIYFRKVYWVFCVSASLYDRS